MCIPVTDIQAREKAQLLCLTVGLSLCYTQSSKHPVVSTLLQVILVDAVGTLSYIPSSLWSFPIHHGFLCLSLFEGFLFPLSLLGPCKVEQTQQCQGFSEKLSVNERQELVCNNPASFSLVRQFCFAPPWDLHMAMDNPIHECTLYWPSSLLCLTSVLSHHTSLSNKPLAHKTLSWSLVL